jgi:hypothetical protein
MQVTMGGIQVHIVLAPHLEKNWLLTSFNNCFLLCIFKEDIENLIFKFMRIILLLCLSFNLLSAVITIGGPERYYDVPEDFHLHCNKGFWGLFSSDEIRVSHFKETSALFYSGIVSNKSEFGSEEFLYSTKDFHFFGFSKKLGETGIASQLDNPVVRFSIHRESLAVEYSDKKFFCKIITQKKAQELKVQFENQIKRINEKEKERIKKKNKI